MCHLLLTACQTWDSCWLAHTNPSLQRDNPVEIHYFPNEARFDKMYFPYYGKRIHVSVASISAHVGSTPPGRMCYWRRAVSSCPPPPPLPLPLHPRRITCSPLWPWSWSSPRRTGTRSWRWSAGSRAPTCATTTRGTSSWVASPSGLRCRGRRDQWVVGREEKETQRKACQHFIKDLCI